MNTYMCIHTLHALGVISHLKPTLGRVVACPAVAELGRGKNEATPV